MKTNKHTILVAVLGLVILLVYLYFNYGSKNSKYNWSKTFEEGTSQPYDFGVFKELLQKSSNQSLKVVKKNLKVQLSKASQNSSYMFIGRHCFLSKSEIDSLLVFANNGHDVIFIAEGLPEILFQSLVFYKSPLKIERFEASEVKVESNNVNSKLGDYTFNYRGFDQKFNEPIDWYYLAPNKKLEFFLEEGYEEYIQLNSINEHLNYVKFKVGDGNVFIHTSPLLFTNYALLNDTGFIYANEVFNEINNEEILYDIASRNYKFESETIAQKSDSPLSYILKHKSLRIAWYLFLTAALLFFIFRAKRKQRIVPVLAKKTNTSLKFIETLSGLYYNNANHKQMAESKMAMFTYFIRHKLNISTHTIQSSSINQIALRSGVPVRVVERIFEYYNQVIENNKENLEAENLIELHNRISQFYDIYQTKKYKPYGRN
ncbi:MAG: hypothetical protein R2852_08550 [Bacteroidia bacterium]